MPCEIDSSRMPIRLGSALRVPSYAYPAWGIPEGSNREESERQYEIEWLGGSPRQMEYVVKAITESGLGNYSQMLRDENAALVSRIVRDATERLNYLEVGAGVSTVNVYEKLIADGLDTEKLFGTLVEPSRARLESAVEKLAKLGLKLGKHFEAYGGTKDTDVNTLVPDESQDIVSSVAQIHHHAYLDAPVRALYRATKPEGLLIVADWHNDMWTHPNRVYEFLRDEFDWPTKDEDLAAFAKAYSNALNPAPELTRLDANSNANIKKFWKSWANVRKCESDANRFMPEDDILMLEAHRPVERYETEFIEAGYRLKTVPRIRELLKDNPKGIVEGSGILYVTIGQKHSD